MDQNVCIDVLMYGIIRGSVFVAYKQLIVLDLRFPRRYKFKSYFTAVYVPKYRTVKTGTSGGFT